MEIVETVDGQTGRDQDDLSPYLSSFHGGAATLQALPVTRGSLSTTGFAKEVLRNGLVGADDGSIECQDEENLLTLPFTIREVSMACEREG